MHTKVPLEELKALGVIDQEIYDCFYLTDKEKKENEEELSKNVIRIQEVNDGGHSYFDVLISQLIFDLKKLTSKIK